jgi:NADH-quinone oxidoreductase subunit G
MSTTVPQTDLATVTIDGVDVQVPKGTLLVEAAKLVKNEIPVYCYHTKLGPAGLCRVCLVDIEGMPKLQIACNTPVTDGMKVYTQNDKANEGRRAILEFLLLNHPLDCPICDKGGECDLQDYSMAYGQGASRMVDAKDSKPKAVDLGPTIVLDEERCILCLRCVRFDEIITREQSLRTDDRGAHAIIATATGQPYVSDFSGNVTEICPVGALTSKTYRFKSRPWDNHRTNTTCTQCSVGCQMHVDERGNAILRTMSVEARRPDHRRLAVRSRPVQCRLRRRRTPHHAAAVQGKRNLVADRLGRRARNVGRRAQGDAGRKWPGVGGRDRRRPAASTKKRFCCSTFTARWGSRTSIGAPADRCARIPVRSAERTSISKTPK